MTAKSQYLAQRKTTPFVLACPFREDCSLAVPHCMQQHPCYIIEVILILIKIDLSSLLLVVLVRMVADNS